MADLKTTTVKTLLAMTLLLIAGCGGGSMTSSSQSGFVNQSNLTEANLQDDWTFAEGVLSTQPIEINAAAVAYQGAAPVYLPANPALANVAVPLVYVRNRNDNNGQSFLCGLQLASGCTTEPYQGGFLVQFSTALPQTLAYEFENVILATHGYDVSGR